jgi:hypothetical protein
VFWLQGPGFFADLRQPTGAPDFSHTYRLADVSDAQLAWMAKQEAFAGDLQFDGDVFEWDRAINLQPQSDRADRGRLVFEDRVLVERGEFNDYIEHWHRAREPRISGAARLIDENDGCIAYLIRVDSLFMYARGRAPGRAEGRASPAAVDGPAFVAVVEGSASAATVEGRAYAEQTGGRVSAGDLQPLCGDTRGACGRVEDRSSAEPRGATLTEAVLAAPSPQAARRLLDFEVAFGQVDNGVWRIERSSLPFRAGQSLEVSSTSGFTLSVMDSHFDEGTRQRHWRIADLRGDLQTVFYPTTSRAP